MTLKKRWQFIEKSNSLGETSLVPYIPLRLSYLGRASLSLKKSYNLENTLD
ncbi:hypothetical protein RI030_02795 [Aphanizomenon flos-aquae NRERC-008]|jgi:hypothetical protein|uniref:Uncharacterized protein n=1 Tax=Aphanizomenon flos-aquae FACHB-1249 TaxID=2692889 RepID=A0ABR8IUY3_APHFL|nr:MULTISPECIES: hypothetical protein [Aphanizomenonaceae]MBO1044595.1 hypothetical protein [Aphanizomenon flos-aquae UKL13-PB]MBD2392376.1 hypothetical protein [Aphanizomenon flos-aquae FACHB-1171]MBD2558940.1 hypothetical protein [Aphanizomenon flos-aquae FACHB-1290]MBD2633084.1 hypothetical protein [Aphanizomenon sp. FACHB-1399]MBD2643956.1 hypothetical protein [Aphanizomenon sp. FACHB-1401]